MYRYDIRSYLVAVSIVWFLISPVSVGGDLRRTLKGIFGVYIVGTDPTEATLGDNVIAIVEVRGAREVFAFRVAFGQARSPGPRTLRTAGAHRTLRGARRTEGRSRLRKQ